MRVELRTSGLKMTRAQARVATQQVHDAFERLSHRVARVLVSVQAAPGARTRRTARECMIEMQMVDGHVERIQERQRHLGALLRRAVGRAWQAALQWLVGRRERQPLLHLPAPTGLQAVPVRADRVAPGRGHV